MAKQNFVAVYGPEKDRLQNVKADNGLRSDGEALAVLFSALDSFGSDKAHEALSGAVEALKAGRESSAKARKAERLRALLAELEAEAEPEAEPTPEPEPEPAPEAQAAAPKGKGKGK